jgi:NAD(P)-dependent dehydrogenase (short-subunit alcohol dehydrogenase family)
MQERFEGQVVLITGSAGGIGQAMVERFTQEGARLVLVDWDQASLQTQAAPYGDRVLAIPCDVSDAEQVELAMGQALAHFGHIDVGVLNAGIEGRFGELEHLKAEDLDRVMAVNVRGVFLWLSLLLKAMKTRNRGAITVISSTGGLRGSIGMGPYVASKHAVLGLMKCAALEGADAGVRVNAVNPGPVDTRMIRSIEEASGIGELARDLTVKGIPLKRVGQPKEIASMVAYLSAEESGFATGGTFVIDGGIMAGRGR